MNTGEEIQKNPILLPTLNAMAGRYRSESMAAK
jgi:hypothetical protein